MKLYHYAKEAYPVLKTRAKQGITEQPNVAGTTTPGFLYNGHISFFLEPIPTDIMAGVYGKDHRTWFPGSKLYEHVVEITRSTVFRYRFVETPEKTAIYVDDSITEADYLKRLDRINKTLLYVGNSYDEFAIPYKRLSGKLKEHILRAKTLPKWNKDQYACYVPHVMIYPVSGELEPSEINRVTIK